MPDEVAEQTAAVEAPQTIEAQPEQTLEAVPEPGLEAASANGGAEPEPSAFDYSTEEGIRAAIVQNEALARVLKQEQDNSFNAGKQRRESELRREQGATERARAWQEHIANKYGVQLDPDDARQGPLFVKANEDFTRAELMRALLNQAAELDDTARGFAEQLEGKPEELTTTAQIVLDAITKRARSDERSKVESEAEARYAAKLEAELKAREVEVRTASVENPPDVMGSAPGNVGSVTDRLNSMSDSEWQRLVRSNRAEAEALIAQSRSEQLRAVGAR